MRQLRQLFVMLFSIWLLGWIVIGLWILVTEIIFD
jgi:hypothetical protein